MFNILLVNTVTLIEQIVGGKLSLERKQLFFLCLFFPNIHNSLNISRGKLKYETAERVLYTISKKMNGLYLMLWSSQSGLFQMKRSKEGALCCVSPVLAPCHPVLSLSVLNPTESQWWHWEAVGGWSEEKILLWEPAAERALIGVWLLQQGKRWALVVSGKTRMHVRVQIIGRKG